MSDKLITILGPTAVGKTKFAVKLASVFNGEIISADSRQVYRLMDIGTGKDLSEYSSCGNSIPYHLIDICDPTEEFNLFTFRKEFVNAYSSITGSGNTAFLVGGTGMYLSSILQDYTLTPANFKTKRARDLSEKRNDELKEILLELNPNQHNLTDLVDKERIIKAILIAESASESLPKIELESLVIGVSLERQEIKKNITRRLKVRLNSGMIDEVKNLLDNGISTEKLKFFGLEYKFIAMYLNGEMNYNDMYQKLNSAIHQFAKRQMTWFRKMEREGVIINWLAPENTKSAELLIENFLAK